MAVLAELNLYPIKSCAGISLREATLTPAGLMTKHIYDREWMVVDAQGEFVTQRHYPQMATIVPRIKGETLELRAPGMLPLEIPLDLPDPDSAPTLNVKIWDDAVKAYDCDELAATWFTKVLGVPCRLARFHPHAKRLSNTKWTGGLEVPNFFSDGYPILVISEESLADLNDKLKAQGRDALPMNRFRPNVVIGGIGAFEEDYALTLRLGAAILKPIKPCPRCPVPSIDQATGIIGPSPLDILQTYRANPKVDGGLTFGMNSILLEGENEIVRIGQEISIELNF
ncbi:MAG: MOSC N-terminal beta barrel domain-containing protein [Burkholderiales bacterium]|nr:MOSC N-terminal beta barrel domain-containing protein [Burkholderiales bacterium]